MPSSKALNAAATAVEPGVAAAVVVAGLAGVDRGVGFGEAEGSDWAPLVGSVLDRFVLGVVVVRGRTVVEEFVFWERAVAVDIAEISIVPITNLFNISYSSLGYNFKIKSDGSRFELIHHPRRSWRRTMVLHSEVFRHYVFVRVSQILQPSRDPPIGRLASYANR